MSIKSILTLYNGLSNEESVLDSALALTHSARASLRVVHLTPSLIPDVTFALYGGMNTKTLDKLDDAIVEAAAKSETQVKATCSHYGVPFELAGDDTAMGQARVGFRTVMGSPRECLPEQACTVDLIVTGYDNRPDGDLETVLACILEADCPVLALPRNPAIRLPTAGFPQTLVLAWDGSRASARALRQSVPLMLRAQEVYVLHVQTPGDPVEAQLKLDLLTYLRSHCIAAEFIALDPDGGKTGAKLLAEAQRLRSDLLVMGAYGFSHIGEMLLGGVTDYVLKHADMPLLLAH